MFRDALDSIADAGVLRLAEYCYETSPTRRLRGSPCLANLFRSVNLAIERGATIDALNHDRNRSVDQPAAFASKRHTNEIATL